MTHSTREQRSEQERAQRSFEGQLAIVIGGSRGIGLGVARELDRRGCQVIIASRDVDAVSRAADSLQRGLAFAPCDVRDRDQVNGVFELAQERFGKIDIVLTSAGIGRAEDSRRLLADPVAQLEEDEWDAVLDTNLRGMFLTCRAAGTNTGPAATRTIHQHLVGSRCPAGAAVCGRLLRIQDGGCYAGPVDGRRACSVWRPRFVSPAGRGRHRSDRWHATGQTWEDRGCSSGQRDL